MPENAKSQVRQSAPGALDQQLTYQHVLESIPGIVFLIDAKGRLLAWNRNLEEFAGIDHEALAGVDLTEVVHPADRDNIQKKSRAILRSGHSDSAEVRLINRQRQRNLVFMVHGSRVCLEGKKCILGIALDQSAVKVVEQELALARKMLMERNESLRIINQLHHRLQRCHEVDCVLQATLTTLKEYHRLSRFGIFLYTPETRNFSLAASHGFDIVMSREGALLPSSGSLTGVALTQGGLAFSNNISLDPRLDPRVRQILMERGIEAALVIPLLHASRPLGSLNLIFDKDPHLSENELNTLLAIGAAVSNSLINAQRLKELQTQSYQDKLTGLPKRLLLHEQFGRIADDMEAQGWSTALLLVNLEHFGEINHNLGHAVGDSLLRHIALRLKALIDKTQGARIFRLDGAEFLVLLPEVTALEPVLDFAQTLLETLNKPFETSSLHLEVCGNIGITIAPRDGNDSRTLLRCADIALSEARQQERKISLYSRTLDHHTGEHRNLLAEIGHAIRNKNFCLHYQPQLDLANNRVVGFEALVRWQHPRLGLLLPANFLALTEMTEDIHRLSREILHLGLTELRRWREDGHEYTLSLNLSARNLQDERYLDELAKQLREGEPPPEAIELEITESALAGQSKSAVRLLARLHELGARLAMDSFGAAHSSLALLRHLPVTTLKIDQSFIQGITERSKDEVIVRSAIDLAHNLGMRIIAKGVEQAQTLNLLRDMGCDLIQGNHYCPPKPWREMERWLSRN